ncbi:MAG: TetR/AcrR family transcriptional regulator [Streptosporangiaceae bacterium]
MTETGRAPVGSEARRARAGRILDAAAELLSQHGYRRVSIDDVAALARVGKGTIYLHWKTREVLFWAALQREAMRMLDDLVRRLDEDPGLAIPRRLMPAIFLEVVRRPLVKAVLLSDAQVLGALVVDDSVAAAQRELAGNPDYLVLAARHGLLRPGLSTMAAGHILSSVLRGFFFDQDEDAQPGGARELSVSERADLLADVLARTLEPDTPAPEASVTALGAEVTELFRGITAVQRAQLERAY